MIPIVVEDLGAVPKGLEKRLGKLEIRGRIKTKQTTAVLKSDRIDRIVLDIWSNLLSLSLQWKLVWKTCKEYYNKSEEKDKYLDLARELKKLWNMKVTIIPIVIGAFGTVTKELLKGLEDLEVGGWVETIQTTALWRTARILRRVLETWGNLLSLKLQWKTIILLKIDNN